MGGVGDYKEPNSYRKSLLSREPKDQLGGSRQTKKKKKNILGKRTKDAKALWWEGALEEPEKKLAQLRWN